MTKQEFDLEVMPKINETLQYLGDKGFSYIIYIECAGIHEGQECILNSKAAKDNNATAFFRHIKGMISQQFMLAQLAAITKRIIAN